MLKIHYFGASRRAGKTTWLVKKIKELADNGESGTYIFVVLNLQMVDNVLELFHDNDFIVQANHFEKNAFYKDVRVRVVSFGSNVFIDILSTYDKMFMDDIEWYDNNRFEKVMCNFTGSEIYTTQSGEIERDYLAEFIEDNDE